jgi:hypothetical protein
LPGKNTLKAADAQVLEQAFQSRMTVIDSLEQGGLSTPSPELASASGRNHEKFLGQMTGAA